MGLLCYLLLLTILLITITIIITIIVTITTAGMGPLQPSASSAPAASSQEARSRGGHPHYSADGSDL